MNKSEPAPLSFQLYARISALLALEIAIAKYGDTDPHMVLAQAKVSYFDATDFRFWPDRKFLH